MILVDTCVLPDVLQADENWADWSPTQIERAAAHGGLLISPIIYAELSIWYDDMAQFEHVVAGFGATYAELPRETLFLAGMAFRQYRSRGGTRTRVLSDFFIGAHAAVQEITLLTRDTARFRSCFPTMALLTPATA